jgi:hypothetical protein
MNRRDKKRRGSCIHIQDHPNEHNADFREMMTDATGAEPDHV